MQAESFTAQLRADGFQEILERESPPSDIATHTHAWDARVLVLRGSFHLEREGIRTEYGPGEHFEVPLGAPHAEGAGPEGALLLVGRRRP